MTKTSIYCYEKNGGSCRNKVSLANNYICSAGHGGGEQASSVSSGLQKVAPAINLSRMSPKRKESIAKDPSTSPETLALLAREKSIDIRYAVADNSSASRETHISLAQRGHVPWGFTKDESIDELIKDIHLVDQYPKFFGRAYLDRLLNNPPQEDETHPKRRALIGYVYAKYTESDKADSYKKQLYKGRIKALFPDDQEIAEIVGY